MCVFPRRFYILFRKAIEVIAKHDQQNPLFLYLAYQVREHVKNCIFSGHFPPSQYTFIYLFRHEKCLTGEILKEKYLNIFLNNYKKFYLISSKPLQKWHISMF